MILEKKKKQNKIHISVLGPSRREFGWNCVCLVVYNEIVLKKCHAFTRMRNKTIR